MTYAFNAATQGYYFTATDNVRVSPVFADLDAAATWFLDFAS